MDVQYLPSLVNCLSLHYDIENYAYSFGLTEQLV